MPVRNSYSNVLSWASILDDKTVAQAEASASLPFIEGKVALMPDAHFGFGSTVGSVIPTKGAIIPGAIGVDIGCGMIAVETNLTSADLPDDLTRLHEMIVDAVPAGVGKGHETGQGDAHWVGDFPSINTFNDGRSDGRSLAQKARIQFGSMGGGNHFCEVCLDERDVVWVVLHSGSRGVGKTLAEYHIGQAQGLMRERFIDGYLPIGDNGKPNMDLAFLTESDPQFHEYIADMLWAQTYALGSRETMMDATLRVLAEFLGRDGSVEIDRINCHHNFTQQENHHGKNVWLTRKGAIQARQGDRGIIPGSMGAATFIVEGLGNKASYNSCSHGAGRVLSRGQARRGGVDLEEFRRQMAGKAWDADKAEELVDEAPGAYKPIEQVMADQSDLVKPLHVLHQVLNMKGTQ